MNAFYIKVLSLVAFAAVSLNAWAAPSEAEYKKVHETWTLNADGSQEYRCAQELTLFTHTAMNGTYGETFIVYDPQWQKLVIHDSYTRQKDGTIVRTPANAFVEVLPRAAAGAPAYNHLKEMVIVHTGLELGATIVLDYSIVSQPGYLPELDVCKQLQKTSPVKEYTLTFVAPTTKPMRYKALGTKAQPAETTAEGKRQLKWTLRNLAALPREEKVSLQDGNVPGLLLTTYPSAGQAFEMLGRQFEVTADQQTDALARQLTQDCKTDTEKIYAVQNYVLHNCDACSLSLSETGYRLRPASTVVTTAYGTAAEKVNLMTALLKAAGVKARPAALCRLPIAPEQVSLSTIDELIVIAEADGKQFELSSAHTAKAADGNSLVLDLADAKEIKTGSSSPAAIRYNATITWTGRKANAVIEAAFSNCYVPYIANIANELLPIGEGNQVKPAEQSTTITGNYAPDLHTREAYTILSLPATYKGVTQSEGYERYNSRRQSTLLLPALLTEAYHYTVVLPDSLTLCSPEKEKKIENAVGSLSFSLKQEGRNVMVNRSLQLNKQRITPADYPAFRQLMTEWADRNDRQLLLKAGN